MLQIKRYTQNDKLIWDEFNKSSKNSLFMFDRDYMDYHSDRFVDHSLLFYNSKAKLIATIPMTENGYSLISHGGLTYGGFITNLDMRQSLMDECFYELKNYATNLGFESIVYKTIPHIFHKFCSEEDRYSLFRSAAVLKKIEPSTTINLFENSNLSNLRIRQIKKAIASNVKVSKTSNYEDFCEYFLLLNDVLKKRHNVNAVHTVKEIFLLYNRFKRNIHLFIAKFQGKIIAGTIIYEYSNAVHTQYLAADDLARALGALDLVVWECINHFKTKKQWFDFGISTENGGRILNQGLISQKEGFGGRTCIYETWKMDV